MAELWARTTVLLAVVPKGFVGVCCGSLVRYWGGQNTCHPGPISPHSYHPGSTRERGHCCHLSLGWTFECSWQNSNRAEFNCRLDVWILAQTAPGSCCRELMIGAFSVARRERKASALHQASPQCLAIFVSAGK